MPELGEYRGRRDPKRTPEPFEGDGGGDGAPIFVVQRHAARRLHYDFRLERDGVLASWAVPRGLPLERGDRRLAVHVEDHPLAYAGFSGTIPKGEYGAGTVEIFDHGTYELLEEKPDGGLTVRLRGRRLHGVWTLVPARLSGDERNWLVMRKDEARVEQVRYAPMLASVSETVPPGEDWRFEVKWDGYRTLARLSGGSVELWSRNGNDLTERFNQVARALPGAVGTPDCVLDGEVCALDEEGRARFSLLQQGDGQLVMYVFDVLELDGEPLLERPYAERRERLEALLSGAGVVRLSRAFPDGEWLLQEAGRRGLEGVIAKRLDSEYCPGRRTRQWLKVKPLRRQEFVIVGYTRGRGRREGSFGALVLAVRRGDELVWVGNCGTGFGEREIAALLSRLRPLERRTSPLAVVPRMARVKASDVRWVTPRLVCEVEFAEWTHGGQLRAPSYKGLRDDRRPEAVRREYPEREERTLGRRTVTLGNLGKVFWAREGIRKGDLLDYYEAVADALVPHLRDRPFTMKRYPDGSEGKHFFQKDAPVHMPEWIPTAAFPASSRKGARTIRYPLVNEAAALLWMVNMGCIDMNAWYSRADRPERPDFVLFDLDPTPDVGFRAAVRVALLVRDALAALGLQGYPKTSGADGLHVLVPVTRRTTYDESRVLVETVAGALAQRHPELVTTEWSKARRRGVLIDANQNGPGRTIAFAYSVRPVPGAPVSTPLAWEEVSQDLDPRDFTMEVVLDRLARHGDLYEPVLEAPQGLAPALRRIRGR